VLEDFTLHVLTKMSITMRVWVVLSALSSTFADTADTNPIAKVISMMDDYTAKLVAEDENSKKMFTEFSAFCEGRAGELNFNIKEGKMQSEELKATINEETSIIASLTEKIGELTKSIASADKDLQAATKIRDEEAADFKKEEKELMEVVSMLERALGIIEKEMKKGSASMMQLQSASNLKQAFAAMVQASMFSEADASRLTSLVQSEDDQGLNLTAHDPRVYKSHSGGILGTLEDLKDKAYQELEDARIKETEASRNYEKLKLSLTNEMKNSKKQLAESKRYIAASKEKKSTAKEDLSVTSKTLNEDMVALSDIHKDCMTKATDYEVESKSRSDELKAIATAKKILVEKTGGAETSVYGFDQVSFIQVARTTMGVDHLEAVDYVRSLSRKRHAPLLAQLANNMAAVMRENSYSEDDKFAKVKDMIRDMIVKLEAEQKKTADKIAYCNKEMAETKASEKEIKDQLDAVTTELDQMTSRSEKLTEDVAMLETALKDIQASQAEMDQLRREEKAVYTKQRADLEQGVEGVKLALQVLKEYYQKAGESGSATGIIEMLELVESDFSKSLAEIISIEESAAATYESETKENAVEKATKTGDSKFKSKEIVRLAESIPERKSDFTGIKDQYKAVMDYLAKLKGDCVVKAPSYAEKKAKRDAEIAGLKEAQRILEEKRHLCRSLQLGHTFEEAPSHLNLRIEL